MTKPIITVENLGKAYRLGLREERYPTFRDALVGAAKAPFKRFQHLSGGGNQDDLFWALKDVSFEVQPGEVVGIIGRNGAGKSTLLKVLSRITDPTAGRAILRGRVASLLEVGTGFHPELTGRENIYLNGSILGMKKVEIDRKFDEIVAFAEVEKFLDTPVKRYSSGMYVRLAFAVAAHLEPEILIVDEVLAVGDAQFQKKCLGKMQEVAQGQGRTVLFVSHNMAAVQRLCSRAAWLEQGTIREVGSADDIVNHYDSVHSELRSSFVRTDSSGASVTLTRASVCATGCLTNEEPIPFGAPFEVESFWSIASVPRDLCFAVQVRDGRDRLVFASNTIDGCALDDVTEGNFRLSCRLDANVLTPGTYRVSIGAWVRPYGAVDVVQDALVFKLAEAAKDGTTFNIVGDPAIAPKLDWKLEKIVD